METVESHYVVSLVFACTCGYDDCEASEPEALTTLQADTLDQVAECVNALHVKVLQSAFSMHHRHGYPKPLVEERVRQSNIVTMSRTLGGLMIIDEVPAFDTKHMWLMIEKEDGIAC